MTLTGLSDNVGSCQALLSALLYALKEERHFALLDGVAFPNRRLARNPFRSGHSVRPMHLFGRTRDHDYYFELPRKRGERAAQSITRCWTAHHGLVRTGPRANRTFHSLVIPSLTPHPVQSNRQAPRDRDLGDRPTGADIVMESITLTPRSQGVNECYRRCYANNRLDKSVGCECSCS